MVAVEEMLTAIGLLMNVLLVAVLIREWFTQTALHACGHVVNLIDGVQHSVFQVVVALVVLYWMREDVNVFLHVVVPHVISHC